MTRDEINMLINQQETIILDRQAQLSASDYIDNKIVEGAATKEHYADRIAERQQWRNDINAAQAEIARLEAIEPELEPTPENKE
jgi:hypothetical protein